MKNYDNNIDMFDAYLNNMMSDDDKRAFEKRLDEEPELKQEFKEHKQLIFLIQESDAEARISKILSYQKKRIALPKI